MYTSTYGETKFVVYCKSVNHNLPRIVFVVHLCVPGLSSMGSVGSEQSNWKVLFKWKGSFASFYFYKHVFEPVKLGWICKGNDLRYQGIKFMMNMDNKLT